MTKKHLSNFFSIRVIPEKFRSFVADSANHSLETQVQAALSRGHARFFEGQYALALDAYREAYALIHRFVHPSFPILPGIHIMPELRGLDIMDALLAASVEVVRLRDVVGPKRPIVAPRDPPEKLDALVSKYRNAGAVDPAPTARTLYEAAVQYMQIGVAEQAEQLLSRAEKLAPREDKLLQAHLLSARGVLLLQRNEVAKAQQALQSARRQSAEAGDNTAVAAIDNNLAVASTLQGKVEEAGKAFQSAGDRMPIAVGRTLHQPLNPGTASLMVRPMGQAGLGLVVATGRPDTSWVEASATPAIVAGGRRLGVMVGGGVIDVNLAAADPLAELHEKVYRPRIAIGDLTGIRIIEDMATNFTAYLGHVYGFVVPVAIGDCHFEMGEFDQALLWYAKARDYRYLNLAVEAPAVWLKIARCYLELGHGHYHSGDIARARVEYQKIVRLDPPVVDAASPLYAPAPFVALAAQVQAIAAAPQPIDVEVHNPAIAVVVLLARLNLQNILAGIDLPLLSLEHEQIPVFTFEYLQNVARYFAEHAIQAERTYINFKTSAEQEEFTRSMLENAVALEQANETLEQKKVQVAEEQKKAMEANRAHANLQLANAQSMRAEYSTVSLEQAALDAEITYVGAPTTEYDFSGYEEYGISDGSHRVDEVLRTLTQRRREISREFELHNMDRRITELQAAQALAAQQVTIANAQVEAAKLQRDIATLRRQQSQQQLALFDSQEFTPDLWFALGNQIKAISRTYLDQAIVIARLMEQVYEFEVGEPVDIIKPNYIRNDLSGLLGGDFLLRDIDAFTFLKIVVGQKKQPMKEIISLADRYPVQFLREFQKTGVMSFRTELSDFDRNYPGSYQQRIQRVEVVVEGLIGREGIHGTLTNTGLCLTRQRDGRIKQRLLKPETLLLSRYRIGPDSLVFGASGEQLAIFQHSPVSTSWVFELRPSANDLVFNYITDVKLVVYYEAFFDPDLKQPVLEELAEEQALTGRRTVALRYEMFDEFFAFQDTGEVRFTLRSTMLPFYHTSPAIREVVVVVETEEGVSPAGLTLNVSAGAIAAVQVTDAAGAIASGGGAPLDAMIGALMLQDWVISIPQAANQARFDAGFRWSQVRNIIFVVEYAFVPRRVPGEPYLLLRDRFDADPLARFNVVDDTGAVTNAPSAWQHVAANGRIEQRSRIHGFPAGATATNALKPGTYLVRVADPAVPALQDLIVTARLQSSVPGGIGLVFRWQDANNFYFFLMDSQAGYRRIGKKVGGVFQELATPAVDLTQGYVVNQPYRVRVRAQGTRLQVYLDDRLVLAGTDASLAAAGRAGFYAWRNDGATFDDLHVIQL